MAFLILVIGDLHIPDRALDIPAKFKKLLAPGKISQTLCLGNLTDRSTYEYLRTIAPDLKIVRGRMDVEATSLPLTSVVTHGNLRIGFLEGFTLVSNEPDLLLAEANRLDVDVLCWGGTHKFECFEYMDKFFVNPGSATGAFTTTAASWAGFDEDEEVVPSFCLMDIQGISLTLYVYQLRKDEKGVENVAVEKVTYTKPVEPTGAPAGGAAGAGGASGAASGAASVSS
ncbi:Metallo-dependent phosphatase-like protein [Sordaria brevicollis]|uniref:Vacuolar protein sorting-associated protein 29 n=1 Tax=Sordaria brevicollis TaxID=83679 RepID=A0AAE0UAX8_SORBR|nr:Metallo-dependent phosphatase-like protein [Sordaria brevicollis]